MKRALVTVGAVTLLLLTGCTPQTATGDAEPVPAATEQTAALLTASTPEASTGGEEAAFLDEVRAKLRPDTVIPDATDEQLIEAGRKACELRASGQPTDTISVIEGEELTAGYYRDSVQIVQAAATTIC